MSTVYQLPFGNGMAVQLPDDEFSSIENLLIKEYRYHLRKRYFNVLKEEEDIKNLVQNMNTDKETYLITYETSGTKCLLYLINIDNQNVSLFIDREKRKGFIVNHQFKEELYKNTLFVGELIRDDNNRFIFLIEDIFIHCGDNKNLMYQNIIKRHELISELLTTSYKPNINIESYKFVLKKVYNLQDITMMLKEIQKLEYNVNNLLFIKLTGFSFYNRYVYYINNWR